MASSLHALQTEVLRSLSSYTCLIKYRELELG